MAHALTLLGTGTGVADPPPPTGLALAVGVDTAGGQDSLVGAGSGVAGIPVGLAEGALTVGEALGVAEALGGADALGDAFLLA